MKTFTAVMYDHIEQQDREVDLEKFTGFAIGDRVIHKNRGRHGGNGTILSDGLGTVFGFSYQGEYSWGGACVLCWVAWDDGRDYTELVYNLLEKMENI